MKQQINKKRKKSNNTVDFDIDDLRKQLIKKDSVSVKKKRKKKR